MPLLHKDESGKMTKNFRGPSVVSAKLLRYRPSSSSSIHLDAGY